MEERMKDKWMRGWGWGEVLGANKSLAFFSSNKVFFSLSYPIKNQVIHRWFFYSTLISATQSRILHILILSSS